MSEITTTSEKTLLIGTVCDGYQEGKCSDAKCTNVHLSSAEFKKFKEIADAKDPEKVRAELVSDYTETLSNPYAAAERGTIDSVIEPHQSRAYITKAFRTLKTKRDTLPARKHGNIPL